MFVTSLPVPPVVGARIGWGAVVGGVEIGDGRKLLEREELCNVENRAAADGKDAVIRFAAERLDDALDHEVGRLALAIGAVIDDGRARELACEMALLSAAARKDEVAG